MSQQGLARSVRLFRLFLREQADPGLFYGALAQDAVSRVAAYGDLAGKTVVDVGGGPGYFTTEFRAAGAHCYLFEPERDELLKGGDTPEGAVLADGCWLPVRDGSADICFLSNVLEHVADPTGLLGEMVRVTRPGGLIYLSFTNWYSPWGGHETSPWHYLGVRYAEQRYRDRHGHEPKNHVGSTLFRLHIGATLRMARSLHGAEIIDARPCYYPRWCAFLVGIPLLREVLTWNLLLVLRRTG
ncbi:MAG TPA: class I SAM-dependent methyltransferase [Trebonia sp.]|nr:class I SAM-dependent methyltransferase [Trebonia sp.]